MCLQFLGNLGREESIGTNKLIKNGAYLITSSMDILEKYSEFFYRKQRTISFKENNINKDTEVNESYKKIYSCLGNEYLNIDNLVQKSGLNIREVINIITLMEIDGLVKFELGKGYIKND